MVKDYLNLAKNIDKELMELWEAIKESPHVSKEERTKFAHLVQEYGSFFNDGFTVNDKTPEKESAGGPVPMESGGKKVIIPL